MDQNENNINLDENNQDEGYVAINDRLKQIQNKIDNENLTLDESLDLYEEAVKLGMQASKTLETNVLSSFSNELSSSIESDTEDVKISDIDNS